MLPFHSDTASRHHLHLWHRPYCQAGSVPAHACYIIVSERVGIRAMKLAGGGGSGSLSTGCLHSIHSHGMPVNHSTPTSMGQTVSSTEVGGTASHSCRIAKLLHMLLLQSIGRCLPQHTCCLGLDILFIADDEQGVTSRSSYCFLWVLSALLSPEHPEQSHCDQHLQPHHPQANSQHQQHHYQHCGGQLIRPVEGKLQPLTSSGPPINNILDL